MTPQLQQAIKLLQLNNIELSAFVAEELERNPLLESAEDDRASRDDVGDQKDDGGDRDARETLSADQGLEHGSPSSDDTPLDTDFNDNVFNHDSGTDMAHAGAGELGLNGMGRIEGGGGGVEDDSAFDATLSEAENLHDHLMSQLGCTVPEGPDRLIGAHLIDLVDDTGYISPQEFLEVPARLGCSETDAERVITLLQSFDPVGVCARTLSECLKIQQRELNRLDPAMEALLDNLDLLARGEMSALKRICQVTNEDLTDMIREIQTLNPKPGLAFGGEIAQTVVPDIYIRRSPQGMWLVELNTATLPKVLINQRYHSKLKAGGADVRAKEYLSECLSSANWLIKALDQRARTILRVATELVRQQEAFFEQGVRYLKPLNLRTIAEAIDMHESTVSRVTSNKYLSCNRGVFELKYFFTSAISSSSGGDDHSAEAVRSRIKALIDAEAPDNILSDDAIVDILRAEQIEIARRTVAKYREAMRIPSSVQRRRAKKLAS